MLCILCVVAVCILREGKELHRLLLCEKGFQQVVLLSLLYSSTFLFPTSTHEHDIFAFEQFR